MTTAIIRPYIPPLPYPKIPDLSFPDIMNGLLWIVFIGSSLLIAWFWSDYANQKWNKKFTPYYLALTGVMSLLLLCFWGVSMPAIKGIILCLILIYASNSDIETRQVEDYVPVMIVITAFLGIELSSIGSMLIGAFAVSIPQIFMAILKPARSIGGADIKISAACGFLLGLSQGIIGLMIGMLLAVICTICFNKIKSKKSGAFPLVPYLAAGFMVAYFL